MQKPLSNFDLIHQIAKEMGERANVKDLEAVDYMDNIEELFNGKGHCILFNRNPEDPNGVGHWNVLIRSPKGVIYFDSFGDPITNQKLLDLLKQKYAAVTENLKQYQDYGKSAVCGRYCLFCIAVNKILKGADINQIEALLDMKKDNESYDQFILRNTV